MKEEGCMNFGSMFGKVATTWKQFIEQSGATWASGWVETLLNTLSQVMWVALALVGAAGAVVEIDAGIAAGNLCWCKNG